MGREADEGDFVMINLSATRNGTPVDEVSATDLLYEVGSRSYIPGLDEMLVGVSAGEIKQGPAQLPAGFGDHAGEEVALQVLVKGVKAKRLPDLTDDWVSDVSEFETVDELRTQVERSLLAMKLNTTQGVFRDQLLEELIADIDVELPSALVDAEVESSVHNLAHGLQAQGLDLGTYLSVTGQGQQAFIDDLRIGAERSLKTRILLEAVAADAGITVDPEEIDAAVDEMARTSGRDADELKSAIEANGQDSIVAGDILRRKALARVMEVATPVDADDRPVDLSPVVEDDEEDDTDEAPVEASDEDQDTGPDADEDA